jgi:hypothetical protein
MSTAPLFGRLLRFSGALALVSSLAIPAPVLAAAPAESAESAESAEEIYVRASAKYSAADYESAIELFTAALEKATSEELSYKVRGALLFNLARSHVKAYEEITKDIKNLRSARAIYKRYLDEADEAAGDYGDTAEAEADLQRVEQMLEEEEKKAADLAAAGASGGADADAIRKEAELQQMLLERYYTQANRHRTTGVVLSVVGSITAAGGIGLIGWGATFKGFAETEIESDRSPDQAGTPYSDTEQEYFDSEVAKGYAWMGAGGGAVLVGGGVIGLGVWQFMKGKKVRAEAAAIKSGKKKPEAVLTPVVSPSFQGLTLTGRF